MQTIDHSHENKQAEKWLQATSSCIKEYTMQNEMQTGLLGKRASLWQNGKLRCAWWDLPLLLQLLHVFCFFICLSVDSRRDVVMVLCCPHRSQVWQRLNLESACSLPRWLQINSSILALTLSQVHTSPAPFANQWWVFTLYCGKWPREVWRHLSVYKVPLI